LSGWSKSRQGMTDAAAAFTVIKRVVPVAGGFFCGICRTVHPTWSAASVCVEACWSAQLQAQPTVAIRKGQFTLHRCRFCKREYAEFTDAANCAAQCSEDLVARADREAATAEEPAAPREKRFSTKPAGYTIDARTVSPVALHEMSKTVLMPFQVRNVLINQRAMKPLLNAVLKHASAVAIGKRGLSGHRQEGGSTMAHGTEGKPSEQKPGTPKDPNKKFFRDGAKYVCAVCKAKYFTKIEVEACWDKH